MVRAYRNVGTNGTDRIEERASVLDRQAVDRIGIIAAPDLRRVIHHTGIISSASSAAALEQQIRACGKEFFHQIVNTEHIAVIQLSVSALCCHMAVNIADTAVHIPFDIINLCIMNDGCQTLQQILTHILTRHIKYKLISAVIRHTARNCKCPIRMCTVKITVLGNHLRLKPETEFHAHPMDFFCKLRHGAVHLFLVDEPVAEATVIILSFSKPAIVKHQHLNAKLLRLLCNFQNFFFVEIKIGCFPVVDQNRSFGMLVCAAADMLADDLMILL